MHSEFLGSRTWSYSNFTRDILLSPCRNIKHRDSLISTYLPAGTIMSNIAACSVDGALRPGGQYYDCSRCALHSSQVIVIEDCITIAGKQQQQYPSGDISYCTTDYMAKFYASRYTLVVHYIFQMYFLNSFIVFFLILCHQSWRQTL